MREYSDREIRTLLEGSGERRSLEFKPPFSWSDPASVWLREKLIRSILGMSNNPGGGVIVMGVGQDESKRLLLTGLTEDQLSSFGNVEDVKSGVDKFASLGTDFDVSRGTYGGRLFLIFTVRQFDRRPLICTRNGEIGKRQENAPPSERMVLREGDIYCRPRRGQPRSDRITDGELEELLEIWLSNRAPIPEAAPTSGASDVAATYDAKLKDLE